MQPFNYICKKYLMTQKNALTFCMLFDVKKKIRKIKKNAFITRESKTQNQFKYFTYDKNLYGVYVSTYKQALTDRDTKMLSLSLSRSEHRSFFFFHYNLMYFPVFNVYDIYNQ